MMWCTNAGLMQDATARPCSTSAAANVVGMADVGGAATVVTHDQGMCAVAAGSAAANVTVKVDCQVVR